jgi:hypothetical protein
VLGSKRQGADYAQQGKTESAMRERCAEHRTRQTSQSAQDHVRRLCAKPNLQGKVRHRPEDHPESQSYAKRSEYRAHVDEQKHGGARQQCAAKGKHQPLRSSNDVAAFPGEHGAERDKRQKGEHQRPEGQIEERCADRNLSPVVASITSG